MCSDYLGYLRESKEKLQQESNALEIAMTGIWQGLGGEGRRGSPGISP